MSTQHRTSVRFRNLDSEWYCEYTPNGVNVCEKDITLPGLSEVSLAATRPCRLQLCTVLDVIWSLQYCYLHLPHQVAGPCYPSVAYRTELRNLTL